MHSNQSSILASSVKSLENLLNVIEEARIEYKEYVINDVNRFSIDSNNEKMQDHVSDSPDSNNYNNNNSNNITSNKNSISSTVARIKTKDEIKAEIANCQSEYLKIMSNNVGILLDHKNMYSLHYKTKINDISKMITNNFIKIDSQVSKNVSKIDANIKLFVKYSMSQFDLKYSKFSHGCTIAYNNQYIKLGPKDNQCCAVVLPDLNHPKGYTIGDGKHCWRLYFQNSKTPRPWIFFGICKAYLVGNEKNFENETSWGVSRGKIWCEGKGTIDDKCDFIFSHDENEIDMLVDFTNANISYKIVDDKYNKEKEKAKARRYVLAPFDPSIYYTVHLNCYKAATEIQIAKIDVEMFGKNKKLVKWH